MSVLAKTTIGEIAACKPAAAKLFDVVGIDYACHGNLTLRDACAAAGLDPVQTRHSLDELPFEDDEINWLERPLSELVQHLRAQVKGPLSTALTRAVALIAEHGDGCSRHSLETAKVRNGLGGLADAIRPHFSREEHVVFPIIEHMDGCWSRGETPTMKLGGGLAPAINTLMIEHAALIAALDSVRAAVDEIMDESAQCAKLGMALRDFDHELRQHVHLHNNVLYPRAIALETIACQPAVESRIHR